MTRERALCLCSVLATVMLSPARAAAFRPVLGDGACLGPLQVVWTACVSLLEAGKATAPVGVARVLGRGGSALVGRIVLEAERAATLGDVHGLVRRHRIMCMALLAAELFALLEAEVALD